MSDVPPPEFVAIAARQGFTAVSLMLEFPASLGTAHPMRGDTAMRRQTRSVLDDTGVRLYDASTCRLEPTTETEDFRPMLESAAYLGAERFNVNGNDPDWARLIDRFAALCAIGREYGLRAGLEFVMTCSLRTLPDAVRLIESSGAADAALTIDALHLARSGGHPDDVRALDPSLISYLQLCDGPSVLAPDRSAWEAGRERRLPGDGELPLSDLVGAVGPTTPIGVEAPSESRSEAGVSHEEYAARAMRSLRRLLDPSVEQRVSPTN